MLRKYIYIFNCNIIKKHFKVMLTCIAYMADRNYAQFTINQKQKKVIYCDHFMIKSNYVDDE